MVHCFGWHEAWQPVASYTAAVAHQSGRDSDCSNQGGNHADHRRQARAFRQLHEAGCFVIPNPWDVGSARYLPASASRRWQRPAPAPPGPWALPTADTSRGDAGAHRDIVAATDLPVNADFEAGFADTPEGVAENVQLCVDDRRRGLIHRRLHRRPRRPALPAAARCRTPASRAGRHRQARPRHDAHRPRRGLLPWPPRPRRRIRRLVAYAEAGADCLYAPGISTREQIETVVREVAPLPVNVLVSRPTEFSVADLAAMGVRRISLGGVLAAGPGTRFTRSARDIAEHGKFDSFTGVISNAELNAFFRDDHELNAFSRDDQPAKRTLVPRRASRSARRSMRRRRRAPAR